MKKSICYILSIFTLTSLFACDQKVSSSENTFKQDVKTALNLLKGDVNINTTFTLSREYENPWYAGENNVTRVFNFDSEFRFNDEKTYTFARVRHGEVKMGSSTLIDEGVYESNTGLLLDNYLSFEINLNLNIIFPVQLLIVYLRKMKFFIIIFKIFVLMN